MLPPETKSPSAEGFLKILDLIQALSNCENCERFKQAIEQEFRRMYTVSVRLSEHESSVELQAGVDQKALHKTSAVGEMQKDSLILRGPAGWELTIALVAGQEHFHTGHKLLGDIHQHLANLYYQYKTIELLEGTLNRIQSSHMGNPPVNPADLDKLTPRERQIAEAIIDGLGNAEISSKLNISCRTVEKHLENIFRKLHLENRYQLLTMSRHAPA